MAKADKKIVGKPTEFVEANMELINRANRLLHTLDTPGWKDIQAIFDETLERLANRLDSCPLQEVEPYRKSRLALREVLGQIQAAIGEGRNAKENLEHEPDKY